MSASQNQSSLNEAPNSTPAGTTFSANDAKPSSEASPAYTVGSATAMGHGDHPKDNADDRNAELSGSKQKEEQKEAREKIQAQREQGVNIDGGNGRLQNEGLGAV
ncbi:hypothetical protein ACMFMF_006452 [Clarireedia jacksonii]